MKVSDDLLIKYSSDLIGIGYQCRTKANRQKAKELREKEQSFTKAQQALIDININEEDAVKLAQSNKILDCISSCRRAHNGPMTTVEELNSLVQDSKRSEKELHKSLNLEIRLRKLTFTNVKMTCPLFRQQKLSIELKRKNLESLISIQLVLQVKADMNDLEVTITECSENVETDQQPGEANHRIYHDHSQVEKDGACQVPNQASWLPTAGECIVGLFADSYYQGEVIKVEDDYVEADFLIQASIAQMEKGSSLWKRPSLDRSERHKLHRSSVLPIRPVLELNRYSTHRTITYELINDDLLKKFT